MAACLPIRQSRLRTPAIVLVLFAIALTTGASRSDAQLAREAGAVAATPDPAETHAATLGRAVRLLPNDPRASAAMLAPLVDALPTLEDVVLYHLALALRAESPEESVRLKERLLASHAGSFLAPGAAADLADSRLARNDRRGVVALADTHGAAVVRAADPVTAVDRARLCAAAGKSLISTNPADAAAWLGRARSLAPVSPAGREATELLASLRVEHPTLGPASAADLYDEASIAAAQGDLEAQRFLLERLLKEYPGDRLAVSAALAYARTIAGTDGPDVAAAYLAKLADAAATPPLRARYLYEAGYRLWNGDRDNEAVPLFERAIALRTDIPEEGRSHYSLGRIHEDAGRNERAHESYGLCEQRGVALDRVECSWRKGWLSYRSGDFARAERELAALAASPDSATYDRRATALYWRARALEHLERPKEARSLYQNVLDDFSDGYYAYLAERRLGKSSLIPARAGATTTPHPDPQRWSPALRTAWERARLLAAAGLHDLAARDLDWRTEQLGDEERRLLLPGLPRVGAFGQAFKTAVRLHERGLIARAELEPYLYPKAHEEIVRAEASMRGLDPLLVYSLMRQESAFDPAAVSPAQAIGLMQLLERTARRVAESIGLAEVDRMRLFEPSMNIRLGSAYLEQLSKRFAGNRLLMLAAYNAGEDAAERWRTASGHLDEDEFVEQISYRETRDYVKKILRNVRNYRRIYASG